MAALTWRDVTAPGLADSARVVGETGRNFSGAFNDLAAGIGCRRSCANLGSNTGNGRNS